jgi:hypothetical protein
MAWQFMQICEAGSRITQNIELMEREKNGRPKAPFSRGEILLVYQVIQYFIAFQETEKSTGTITRNGRGN